MLALARTLFFILLCFLLTLQASHAALPFSVEPKAGISLPTEVAPNSTVTAYYTVRNNTLTQRNNSYVKYLPPNTVQVTGNGTFSDTCGATFNLAPQGSCTLQLTISGLVNSDDPDPHHHLFVCFPGGTVCAGTNSPLNIQRAINSTNVYIPEYGNNTVTHCSINSDGSFSACTVAGSGFNQPTGGAINPANHFLYIVNSNSTISYCAIQPDGSLANCQLAESGTPALTLTFNAAGTYAYIPDGNGSFVQCVVAGDGTFNSCIAVGGGVTDPISVVFNPHNTFAYVSNFNNPSYIASVCSVDANGAFSLCHDTGASASLFYPLGMAVNSANTFFYAAGINGNNVTFCAISHNGDLSNCTVTVTGLTSPSGIALNNTSTFLYVADTGANRVLYCAVQTDGSLNNCMTTGTTLNSPAAIILA